MNRLSVSACSVLLVASPALADVFAITASTGWEDPDAAAVLGTAGNLAEAGYDDSESYLGDSCLYLVESPIGGTPEAFVAYISGLQAGDTVHASMWLKGEGVIGKGRLWAHYANDGLGSDDGSAGGDNEFAGVGGEWSESSHTWTIPEGRTGLVIEVRLEGFGDDNRLLGDQLFVGVSSGAANIRLAGQVAPPVSGLGGLAVLVPGLVGIGRRRR